MQPKKSIQELRKFGLVMTLPLLVIGGLLLWKGKAAAPYFLSGGGFFLSCGLLFPKMLAPIEWIWMKFSEALAYLMTRVILTLTFYLVITPIGFIIRLSRKDILQVKIEKDRPTYWEAVTEDDPGTRPKAPY